MMRASARPPAGFSPVRGRVVKVDDETFAAYLVVTYRKFKHSIRVGYAKSRGEAWANLHHVLFYAKSHAWTTMLSFASKANVKPRPRPRIVHRKEV